MHRSTYNENNQSRLQGVETKKNRSSGVQIPRDICTRFGCYLYSTE